MNVRSFFITHTPSLNIPKLRTLFPGKCYEGFFGVVDYCTYFYPITDLVHDSAKLPDELHYVMNKPQL